MSRAIDSPSKAIGVALVVVVGLVLCGADGWHHSRFEATGTDADWDAAARQSHDRNLPAVVLYTADWCCACQALHAGALADPAVGRELCYRHTFVVVDMTRPTATARSHAASAGVHAYPTLIKYDRDGHELDRTHGLSAEALVAWLE
jgi:thiol:disulfide interchange protein